MINREYPSADAIYNSIITLSPGDTSSEVAYLELYRSARLQNSDSTALASLRDLFNTNLESMADSGMIKIVSQLALLTLVDERQYINAINGFADIINQNPDSEEAMFAEIDAMTTSLLAQNGNDTTLGKSMYKKYLVKGPREMQQRLNELIKSRFGAEGNKTTKEFIPTEYSLYNNYPNPFNPTTTIRFDLPERTNVELSVYNILGQKVKTLVASETKIPGRYEVSFNGNSLASGVYIYRLTTQNYSQTKKMLLIK
ncbi:MAG TPA: T9SS type A sorting domain-containing protein [Ignavibacteriaceae bacterium]|nr:T9SS type A sorting domain-containing protein [Ignavibacteriaceae bacterium]